MSAPALKDLLALAADAAYVAGRRTVAHFHTGVVHFYTTKGEWHYLEYPDDVQKAGSYLFEPGGSVHTFCVDENATEPAEGFMVVFGANINFVDEKFIGIRDAGAIEDAILASARSAGLPMPRYIRPKGGAEFSRG